MRSKLISAFIAFVFLIPHANAKTNSIREKIGKRITERSKVKDFNRILPPGAKLIEDVLYGSTPEQMVDIYLPKGKPRPQVLFLVHGGAWEFGDRKSKKFIEHKLKRWVSKGYIMISVGYRLLPKANLIAQANDVAEALFVMQQKVQEWGASSDQFVLIGHSAGAHLVSLISVGLSNSDLVDQSLGSTSGAIINSDTQSTEEKLLLKFKPVLATISLDSALLNAPFLMLQGHPDLYDRALGADPKFWEKISPVHQLKGKVSPFYLVCSENQENSCSQAEEFSKKIKKFASSVEVKKMNISHGEVNEQLGLDNQYTRDIEGFLSKLGLYF
jgi:acetyl esterase/lipase